MKFCQKIITTLGFCVLLNLSPDFSNAQEPKIFEWPEGKSMAISLSWDDGRKSQVEVGTPLLNSFGVKATFYVVPSYVEEALEGWQSAVKTGHEIANHSLLHPCSGNFLWTQDNALEEYTLSQMDAELDEANEKLKDLLKITPTEFAYPCGQTFTGRGKNAKSYVPIVAYKFSSGRTWMDEVPNDPAFCDLSQITGMDMDGKDIKYIKKLIKSAKNNGQWLVLAGHDIGKNNIQTTEVKMLKKLLPYIMDPENGIWVAPVGEITAYIKEKRGL